VAEDLQQLIVHLDGSASDAEVAETREALRASGIDGEVRADWQKDSQTGNGAFWMDYIPIAVPLTAFLTAFFAKAGQDAWDGFRSFVGSLRRARRSSRLASEGWVLFEDSGRTKLMIGDDFSDEAIGALRDFDWDAHRGGQIMWDDEAKEWYDATRRYLESLSNAELFERRSDTVRWLPNSTDPEARRQIWDVIFSVDQEIERRYPPIDPRP
jgi:hypothetical protein